MNNKSGSEGGDVVEQFNAFIKKWCGDSYPHLIDSDENDGERFRDNIRDLQKLCEEQKQTIATLKDLVLDDVPHQYQKRLLEVLDESR